MYAKARSQSERQMEMCSVESNQSILSVFYLFLSKPI